MKILTRWPRTAIDHDAMGADFTSKMAAARIRNDSWKEDLNLRQKLKDYVTEGLCCEEILDFMLRDFDCCAWSIRTLQRRLRYLDVRYTDTDVAVDEVEEAITQEMEGPGRLQGHRAMQKKLRQVHDLRVPRGLVHAVMYNIDPVSFEERTPCFKKKKTKGHFTMRGPNWVHSLNRHDKLMGFQNSTFPIAGYGCIDTCSWKLLWVKVRMTNNDPNVIGQFYLKHLFNTKVMASIIRVDKGTETGVMASMHAYLCQQHEDDMDPTETVIYGPSTSNQVGISIYLSLRYPYILAF